MVTYCAVCARIGKAFAFELHGERWRQDDDVGAADFEGVEHDFFVADGDETSTSLSGSRPNCRKVMRVLT